MSRPTRGALLQSVVRARRWRAAPVIVLDDLPYDTGGGDILWRKRMMEVATVTRIETTVTVNNDGVSATIALPAPIAPGRHQAVVIIDDKGGSEDPGAWAARTYGSVADETFERGRCPSKIGDAGGH
jgi:hypothetical protein